MGSKLREQDKQGFGPVFYLLYKTDFNHSYSSRDLIAVATSPQMALELAMKQASNDGCKLNDEQIWNMRNLLQTQGHNGDYEFDYDEVEADVLL